MLNNLYINATDVRKDFSRTIDNVIHIKPQFIKRTHNHLVFIEEKELNHLLSNLKIHVSFTREDNGTYIATNSVIEDVFSTGATKQEAIDSLCKELIEYANEYYDEYDLYSKTPNRKDHAAYVMRILSSSSIEAVKEMLDA